MSFSSPSPFWLLLAGEALAFVSRAKVPPTKRSEKGDGDENGYLFEQEMPYVSPIPHPK